MAKRLALIDIADMYSTSTDGIATVCARSGLNLVLLPLVKCLPLNASNLYTTNKNHFSVFKVEHLNSAPENLYYNEDKEKWRTENE